MSIEVSEQFTPIRKGLLEFAVLTVISGKRVYAADILRKLSLTQFATQEGTLYPLLSKLRRERLVDYQWKESETGPPRKYYDLTEKGAQQLRELKKYWITINTTLANLEK